MADQRRQRRFIIKRVIETMRRLEIPLEEYKKNNAHNALKDANDPSVTDDPYNAPYYKYVEGPQDMKPQNIMDPMIPKFPILAKTINISAVDPLSFDANRDLPAIMFGYGQSFINETITASQGFHGETLSILVNVIFEKYTPMPDDEMNEINDWFLAQTAARWQDAISIVVPDLEFYDQLRNSKGEIFETIDVRNPRLSSVSPFSEGLSDREFLRFAIELDWIYPKRIKGEE